MDISSPQAFIFIGRSGCGKGTQAALLEPFVKKKTGLPVLHIETGPLFRDFIKGESYSSQLSQTIYATDARQPDFLACYMWTQAFLNGVTAPTNMILDGVSRSLDEAELLDTAFTFYGFKDMRVIHLNVSREWSAKHLLARGRSDDASMERINKRLDWFEKDVLPSIEYYRTNPFYHFMEVNGEQPIEKVGADILALLSPQTSSLA